MSKEMMIKINDLVALIGFIKNNWDASGECNSCGWHASLSEYDIPEDLDIDWERGKVKLSCKSKDDDGGSHRGVTIYFNTIPEQEYECTTLEDRDVCLHLDPSPDVCDDCKGLKIKEQPKKPVGVAKTAAKKGELVEVEFQKVPEPTCQEKERRINLTLVIKGDTISIE